MRKNMIVLPDGTELSSGVGTVNAIQSVTLTQCVNSGEELTIGSACAAMLEATVLTPGGGLNLSAGDEVVLYHLDDAGERTRKGVYILEKPARPSANTVKLTGYDRVTLLDRDLTQWLDSLSDWPYTLHTFAGMVCDACGVTLVTEQIPNGDFLIHKFQKQNVTGRQLMKWVGELSCRFCRANAEGDIELSWYTPSEKQISSSGENRYFSGSLSYETYQVASVDKVQIRLATSEDGYLWPAAEEGDNCYILTDNPLMGSVTEDLQPVLDTIRQQLCTLSYTPCKVVIPLREDIRPGDILQITDGNGNRFSTLVMTAETTGQRMTLESTGFARRNSTSAQNNKTPQQLANQVVQNLTQAEVFNKLTNGGALQGLYMKDGELYINASYLAAGTLDAQLIRVINLIAEKLNSVSGESELTVDGASVSLKSLHGETFSVQNWDDGVAYLYMRQYDSDGNDIGRSQLGANRLYLGGTWSNPALSATAGYQNDGSTWSRLCVDAVNPGKKVLYSGSCTVGDSCTVENTDDFDLFAIRLGTDSTTQLTTVLAYKNGNTVRGVGGWAGTSTEYKQLQFFSATVSGNVWTLEDAGIHDIYSSGGIGAGTRMQLKQVVGVI